jgi:hypothetical protein
MAMLLMALYQHQRIICKLCQDAELAILFLMRIRHIQQSLNVMRIVQTDCDGLDDDGSLQQQISLSAMFKDQNCAPVA